MTEAEIRAGMIHTAVIDMKRLVAKGNAALGDKEENAAARITQLIVFGHLDGVIMMSERLALANKANASGRLWKQHAEVYRGIGRAVEAIPVARAARGMAALIEDLERDIKALTKHKPNGSGNALAVNMKPVRA